MEGLKPWILMCPESCHGSNDTKPSEVADWVERPIVGTKPAPVWRERERERERESEKERERERERARGGREWGARRYFPSGK